MDDEGNPWKTNATREVYDNPWISLREDSVTQPNGTPGIYGVVHFKNLAIGVLPIDAEGCTYLVGQHRYPLGAYSWELPEGGGARDATPLSSAQRELKEETGLTAADWLPFLEMDLSNSVSDECAICFLAWNLTAGAAEPDDNEVLKLRRLPLTQAFEEAESGAIRDAMTVAMLFKARHLALQGRLPDPICSIVAGEGGA